MRMSRRSALLAAGAAACVEWPATAAEAKPEAEHRLWYRQPAREWLEALPVGNGRLGAMVFGGVPRERLQLNEGTLWAGGPHDYTPPDAAAALPEIRRLIFAGEWRKAQDLVAQRFMSRPLRQMPYQTLGSLFLEGLGVAEVQEYRRELDLDSAVVSCSYTAGGVRFTREVFASMPDQVIVVRLTADRPRSLSFTARFETPHRSAQIRRDGSLLAVSGVGGSSQGIPGAVRFYAAARFLHEGGELGADPEAVRIAGADAVTILLSMGTSYRGWEDVSGDAAAEAERHLDAAAGKSHGRLRRAPHGRPPEALPAGQPEPWVQQPGRRRRSCSPADG
jgi:alpha-L-fucosidase 2